MRIFIFILSVLASSNLMAAGNITYLNVVENLVYFSTSEVKASSPECVDVGAQAQWSLSLGSISGRALYAILVSAMSTEQAISVESADDCNDANGVERARGLTVAPTGDDGAGENQIGGGLSLYKGDGTRLGRILALQSPTNISYIPDGKNNTISSYNPTYSGRIISVYFESEDCSGTGRLKNYPTALGANPHYQDGKFITYDSHESKYVTINATLLGDGTCQPMTPSKYERYYEIKPYIDGVCGEYPCVIKG